jgi:hypothetical protein
MMGRNRHPPNDTEHDISWRTRELGPEMRRKMFEKLVPSGGRDTPKQSEHPKDKPKGRGG